jgi:hypothetical protein
MRSWTVAEVSSTREISSDTASQPTTEVVALGIDPGNPTGFAYAVRDNPVPYEERLAFWQRTKARLAERRRERQAEQQRDQMSIYEWAGVMPNPHLRHVHIGSEGVVLVEGELDFARFATRPSFPMPDVDLETGFTDEQRVAARNYLERRFGSHPISSARRTPTRDAVIEKIKLNTVDIEPVLDVADMIVAHRNGATALERPLTIDEQCESPVWEDLVECMWDPTRERGPRERDWVRQQHKRQQPTNKTRAQRKGKR